MDIKHKISIIIPSRGQCNIAFAIALRSLQIPAYSQMEIKYITGCFIDMMRNQLVDSTHQDLLLFLDDDILPSPQALIKLIEDDKDITTGIYYSKQQPNFPQIYKTNKEDDKLMDSMWEFPKDKLFEVDACGAGFMLVKKKVFEKIGLPYFKYIVDEEGKRVKGEDLYFCNKAKKAGYKIWCDPTVICKHISEYFIGPEYWEQSLQQLNEMKEKMTDEEWQKFLEQSKN